jgi:hypothetical protein
MVDQPKPKEEKEQPPQRKRAALRASVMWIGENALGAAPLLAYLLIHHYRTHKDDLYLCPVSTPPPKRQIR